MAAPKIAEWSARHGLIKIMLGRAARKGDIPALLMIDRTSRENPFPLYDQIRARGQISQGRLGYAAASHEAASAVLRSDVFRVGLDVANVPWFMRRTMARGGGGGGRIVGPIDPPSLLAVNPPTHSRYRRQVSKVFTPRAIAALEPRVQEIAEELLGDLQADGVGVRDGVGARDGLGVRDGVDARGSVDLVSRYASLLPVTVIAEILGVPVGLRDQFLKWGNAAAQALDIGLTYREYRASEQAIQAMNAWMYAHIERLRRNPGDDLLSKLITVEDDGVRMTDVELMATADLLLAAGFETTVNLIGSGTQLLLSHPDQLQVLRDDPSAWGNAVEEILRFESPVQNTARYAGAPTEVCGMPIPKSGFVQVLIGGANRDPKVFAEPNQFDVRRPNAREHLAFSAGVHYCIGAALARTEGRIGLQTLFERYPDLALAGTPTRRPTRTLRGYATLPVKPGPGQRIPASQTSS